MQLGIRGPLYQDNSFTVTELEGLKLEKLVVCENPEAKSVVIVFIKVENKEWHQFFLDSGYGFWQNYKDIDPTIKTNCDDGFNYIDKTTGFNVSGKLISKIRCTPHQNNCQIAIDFNCNCQLILRTTEPQTFDSSCELIMVNSQN